MTEYSGSFRRTDAMDDGSSGTMITEQVKQQTQEVATQAVQQVQERATSMLESQKQNAINGLTSISEALRQSGRQLSQQDVGPVSQVPDRAAEQVENLSSYLSERNVDDLIGDLQQFAREKRAVLLGGAFVLGILAARFLKSSSAAAYQRSQGFPPGYSAATTPYRYDEREGILTNAPTWQPDPLLPEVSGGA